jgi:hypothetical protein
MAQGTGTEESRRRFLKKAGKLAIYTPPAMMLLMQPNAYAKSSCNNGFGNGAEGCSPNPNGENYRQDEED